MSKEDNEQLNTALSKMPHGVAIAWGLVKEPQRGPKRELSIQKIVDSAIAIADEDGLAAVSMSRVAASLGHTAMSLYRYIPSKDDLLLLMQEAVYELKPPEHIDSADWRDNMKYFVRSTISVFRNHPWITDIPVSVVPITPNTLRIVDWTLQGLSGFEIGPNFKTGIILLLSNYARACGQLLVDMSRTFQTGKSFGEFTGEDYGNILKELASEEQFPNLHPLLMSGDNSSDDNGMEDLNQEFDFGLELILDGIELRLRRMGESAKEG
ncbi:TetR family transcriptional regulator [Paenibacillus antibioticophila]|uniref:TetR family transcriptional regulator n=1 Tax=Paenibacillus antibioticophila TaxID=1274374 RepID=A0A919XRN0_9BACL|nr:TetR/AcrR family transcriptional regulator [Paenibacillus antibioticophila]GIO36704.1 TetR family transcriptional regulator [Paenibacillus antibioticophila]